jgi:hypothetical protein
VSTATTWLNLIEIGSASAEVDSKAAEIVNTANALVTV